MVDVGPAPGANVIIAAYNEEGVIARTLEPLAALAESGEVRVIVVCNGCVDRTAAIARRYPGVVVAELEQASKVAALREGDRLAAAGRPRIYLDADIVMTARACRELAAALRATAVAGRPRHTFDTARAGVVVRSWYRVRQELPSISSALWGAGCYGLSERGRARFDQFPDVVADDLFIDALFHPDEVVIVDTDPLVVTSPRRLADLIRILRRSYRTQTEVERAPGVVSHGQRGQLADLAALARRSPRRVVDVAVYVAVIGWARVLTRLSPADRAWERDVSSRA